MIDPWSAMGRGTMLRAAIVLQLLVHLISGSGQTAFALGVMMPLQSWARHPATARRSAEIQLSMPNPLTLNAVSVCAP